MAKFEDLFLEWRTDLQVSAQGDLRTANEFTLLKQRIVRRLITFPGEVLFQPDFGVGIGRYIDEPLNEDVYAALKRRIIDQVYKEDLVARNPEPEIEISAEYEGISVLLRLWTRDSRELPLRIEVVR